MKNKRGIEVPLENIIFIALDVIAFIMLLFFIIPKVDGIGIMQEKYAKEIALSLDSAHPGMRVTINMSDAINAAEKNLGEQNLAKIVTIKGNLVTVTLSENAGYTYSFFNNLNITNKSYYLDKAHGSYVFFVEGYK